MENHLRITELTRKNEEKAKQLVLEGMKEHFGFIDHSLNPDLYPILKTYKQDGCLFLTGCLDRELICTGGIIRENQTEGGIVRMSIAKKLRGKGYAKTMLAELRSILDMPGLCSRRTGIGETRSVSIKALDIMKIFVIKNESIFIRIYVK